MTLIGQLALSLLPGGLAGLGGFMMYRTRQGRERASAIEEDGETTVDALQPGGGVVGVEGVARATGDDRVTAAMIGRDGVAVRTVVEERVADAVGESRRSDWQTVYADGDYVPFVVDDGTGTVAVEPPDGSVSSFTVDSRQFVAEPGEEPPKQVRDWLATTDGIDAATDQYRNYEQAVIEDGETVYARGEPVAVDGAVSLAGDDRPDEFAVSDLGREGLADEESYGRAGYVVGAVLLCVGLAGLALLWL